MAITYIWKVDNLTTLETPIANDYVIGVNFNVIGTEDFYSYNFGGYQTFEVKAVENFIPFKELTEEIVIRWVQENLPTEQLMFIETKIAEEIESQKNPTPSPVTRMVPWNKSKRPFPHLKFKI